MSTAPMLKLETSNLVALSIAQDCIRRYIDEIASLEPSPVFAFLINHSDIMHALGMQPEPGLMGFGCVRVYLGLSAEDTGSHMRLFLVPVDTDGHDVLPTDDEGHMRVYDFNAPCPATCDVDSPLYFGKLGGGA